MGCGSSNDIKKYTKVDQHIWRGKLTVELVRADIKKDFGLLDKMVQILIQLKIYFFI